MAVFVSSDLHLDHENIIEYCDRPFDSVEEMNKTLVENWNNRVSEDDVVYFLGDLTINDDIETAENWLEQLNGQILFVVGNHDELTPENSPVPVVEQFTFKYDKYEFLCTHRPENIPDSWTGWTIYGHHHNNYPYDHPFVYYQKNQVNVSVELTGYEPVRLDELCDALAQRERIPKFVREK